MPRKKRRSRAAEHRSVLRAHRHVYEPLLAFQGGGCAICGKPPNPKRRHALDHDHKAMELRGILCTACNMRLSDRHTVEWLTKAAEYLTNSPYKRFLQEGV